MSTGRRRGASAVTAPVWVQTPAELEKLAATLADAPAVALDTEGDSLHHYPERLALVQLATPEAVWMVDPLALPDLEQLGSIVADPRRRTVLHAGDNDLTHLKRRYQFRFGRIFDTSIAARFLGAPALGLDVLLAAYLGVTLPPSRQKDDWSARPLSTSQIEYAAADVVHLFALEARLVDELDRVGRLAWVEEECAVLAAAPVPERPVDPNAFAGLKGARDLGPAGLAVLRALHELRERLARSADRPPFRILSDAILVAIAKAAPADQAALAAVPGCTERVIARWGRAILDAVARGREEPESRWPRPERSPRPRVSGAVSRRIEALRGWRKSATERLGLEPGLLLPNRLMGPIAEAAPRDLDALAQIEGVRRWRVVSFGHEMLAAIQ